MIVNKRHQLSTVRRMEESAHTFYLTGSRFFGGFSPTSDWDYFVTDSPTVRVWLANSGFFPQEKDVEIAHYNDGTIVGIYERNDIHIQCVYDALLKQKAQIFLSENVNMRSIGKESRKHLWNLAMSVVSRDMLK